MREFKKQFIPKPHLTVPLFLQTQSSLGKELEIGAGDGEFAIYMAKTNLDSHFIAIEKSRTLFNRMLGKYRKQPLPNLWIFHTNAVWWVTHFAGPNSLNKIYILYPNVYVKSRHINLRWFNRPFFSYLLACLRPAGELEIRTNKLDYYMECKLKMQNYCFMQKKQDFCITNSPRTAFERKYMAQGQICRSLVYKRLF